MIAVVRIVRRQPGLRRHLGDVYAALASMRLGIAVMSVLAIVCFAAMLYEARVGTVAVQRDVYRTGWFGALLGVLALNILCSMMRRYPWQRRHAGFVIAHTGILCVLAGSLVSRDFGTDGTVTLAVGQTTDRLALDQRSLQIIVPGRASGTFPVDVHARRSRRDEQRFALGDSGFTLMAAAYDEARPAFTMYVEGPDGRSQPRTLRWMETATVLVGRTPARVAFLPAETTLPFALTLVDAHASTYAGSARPAAYESVIRVDDPERGVNEHRVSMNRPLSYRGYVFFLASIAGSEPEVARLAVARSPGLPLVYLGAALVAAGTLWMFCTRPAAQRQSAIEPLGRLRSESAT
jgi:hypothetical protein